jgi:hypothetical protein
MYVNVKLTMEGFQWEKAGHTLAPKILGFFSQNSLINHSIHSFPLIWKFGKKILKKGNPNLGITTLFRSRKPMDVIILTQENQGQPLPRNPKDLAQGII